jgi:NAD(P)-dependent dehydrogenase (short-subunit alcohol dehydrogenase family)
MSEPSNESLQRRICAVTGAAKGIGRGIALALSREGARVAVLDRDVSGAEETAGLIAAAGGTALAVRCDVADPESIIAARAEVAARVGDAQVLINNAGITRPSALETMSLSEWNMVLSINLTGYFLCAQEFGRAMRAAGHGVLVHVASIMSHFANPFAGAYGPSKAGVMSLSRQLAAEWAPYGVRSNCVLPGLIRTPMTEVMYDQPGITERRIATVPAGRIGTPEDIAQAAVFLASPRSAYINGTEILVDGGFAANLMSLIPRAGFERNDLVPAHQD